MSQGVGYVVEGQAYSLDRGHVAGVGHVAWCGAMWQGGGVLWQGVGSCGRGWRHVTRDRGIWQGVGWGVW